MSIIEEPAQQAVDPAVVEEFLGRVVADTAAVNTTVMCSIGDRLGLFRALTEGAATPSELAHRTGTDERYVREWCSLLASAGYITHDAASGSFELPAEHAAVLANEGGLTSLAGFHEMTRATLGVIDQVEHAFQHGGGVSYDSYGPEFWAGLDRSTGTAFNNRLLQTWVPAVDGLHERLTEGIDVADIGCGSGRALILLAQAYPNSRYIGYDVTEAALEHARAQAEAAGVADRVAFVQADAAAGIPGQYDVVTTFDVIHDSADPSSIVRAARDAVKDDGVWIVLEINSHDHLDDHAGPLGTLMYGISVMHCMTVSLAQGGAGLGTCGVPESVLRRLCLEGGFESVRRFDEGPFDALYEVRP
jgi:2-polyprenyl-3-methyl-5-hydroxy-6-metoxy-1,4-benzoquinol methylase